MPKLSDEDVRAILVGFWVAVVAVFSVLHLDMERADSLTHRNKVWSSLLSNQKAMAHKLGTPFVNAAGDVEP